MNVYTSCSEIVLTKRNFNIQLNKFQNYNTTIHSGDLGIGGIHISTARQIKQYVDEYLAKNYYVTVGEFVYVNKGWVEDSFTNGKLYEIHAITFNLYTNDAEFSLVDDDNYNRTLSFELINTIAKKRSSIINEILE